MKKSTKIIIAVVFFGVLLFLSKSDVNAAEYIWPIAGNNANETYKDYDFYGYGWGAPYKNQKSGREYIVDNSKWPNEKYFYARNESHYGMDITGVNGNKYKVVSVCNGKVIATSATRAWGAGSNFIDRNQRRTYGGMNDGGGYGNYIIIKESSTGRCFLYAHLKAGSFKVSNGSQVKAGQEIATMGSSGDSGHMHLHFEIRKNESSTIYKQWSGTHSLVTTNSYTNLDPEIYIGSKPNIHKPYTDTKKVKLSKTDIEYYVKYLYKTVLNRNAKNNEIKYWTDKYNKTQSIYDVTSGIFLSQEANTTLGKLSNLDFVKKTYEIILYRGTNYTEKEMSGHVNKLNTGIWNRRDYLAMLCNCKEFSENKIKIIIQDEKKINNKIYIASKENLKKLGDLDGDGYVSIFDATLCLALYSRFSTSNDALEEYGYAIKYADADGDGMVTSIDASHILSYCSACAVGKCNNQSFEEYMGRSNI